jgi:hypothetical protein
VSEGLNIPCGCEGRRDAMNVLFPYNKKKWERKRKTLAGQAM